jgi:hypothetical protein
MNITCISDLWKNLLKCYSLQFQCIWALRNLYWYNFIEKFIKI